MAYHLIPLVDILIIVNLVKMFKICCLLFLGTVLASPVPEAEDFAQRGHLLKMRHYKIDTWLTEEQYDALLKAGLPSEQKNALSSVNYVPSVFAYPDQFLQDAKIRSLFPQIRSANMESFITTLAAFHNRHYNSQYGVQSAQWIFDTVASLIEGSNAIVSKFEHSWSQFSVVVRFPGSNPSLPKVIMGAHQDSTAGGASARAPGADDNGSGSATLMEVVRILAADGFSPAADTEFHWYAAEEYGLLGAKDIAQRYASQNIEVAAMLNYDVVGYTARQNPPVIGVITDYTDATLNSFLRLVVDEFSAVPWRNSVCGYSCSDHAAWGSAGYPASFLIESEMRNTSPYMHTPNDVISTVDFDHLVEFTKIALAFSYELGSLTNWPRNA